MKTPNDAEELAAAGKCACGQAALAAALGTSVADVLPFFPGPGLWVNDRRMRAAIESAGYHWAADGLPWPPEMAVVWIQGIGSWMRPGVPAGARNARTHWIATTRTTRNERGHQMIYDINLGVWEPISFWKSLVLRPLLKEWKATDFECRSTLLVYPHRCPTAT